MISTPFRLTNGLRGQPGVSSYRATLNSQLYRLVNAQDHLTDEKWMNMLGSMLSAWFAYEQHFVHPDSKTMYQLLNELNAIKAPK